MFLNVVMHDWEIHLLHTIMKLVLVVVVVLMKVVVSTLSVRCS